MVDGRRCQVSLQRCDYRERERTEGIFCNLSTSLRTAIKVVTVHCHIPFPDEGIEPV